MSRSTVALVATEGFSTFHFSVPLILFGDTAADECFFTCIICAEQPGLIWSKEGTAVKADGTFDALAQADIVIVPFWENVHQKPSPQLLKALVAARENSASI